MFAFGLDVTVQPTLADVAIQPPGAVTLTAQLPDLVTL